MFDNFKIIFDKFRKFPLLAYPISTLDYPGRGRGKCITGAKRKVGGKKDRVLNVRNLDFRVEGIFSLF